MKSINSNIHSVKAFAPATCANVGVGFDILGFAYENIGDVVTLTRRSDNNIVIESIDFSYSQSESLPANIQQNTASVALQKVCEDLKLNTGFSIHIQKGIPLSSGMGGSAASAVAALVALNKFLINPLSQYQLAYYALFGEAIASGQPHADNIVPCVFGGLTLIQSIHPIEIIQLPVLDIVSVLIHPHLYVSTKQARNILKKHVLLKKYIKQSAYLAGFISGLYQNNLDMIQKSLNDIIIEPQRSEFVPGFYDIKNAALQSGALGVSFSGSGPSIFSLAKNYTDAKKISIAMQKECQKYFASDCWISNINKEGAKVIEVK